MKKFLIAGISILLVISLGIFFIYKFYIIELFTYYYDADQEKKIGNVVLHYNLENEERVEGLEEFFQKQISLQKEGFNHIAEKEIHIVLGKSDEQLQHDDKGSYYSDWQIIYVNSMLEDEHFKNIMAHELAHFCLIEYVKSQNVHEEDIPLWFHEGIAMSFAQSVSPIPITDLVVTSQPLMDITPEKMADGKSAYYSEQYTEMMFAVEYMIHQNRMVVITEIIEKMSDGATFREAFEDTTKIDIDSYHLLFNSDHQALEEVGALLNIKEYEEAKNRMLLIFEEKGFYFNEAPLFLGYLADIYIEEKDYQEAEKYLIRLTEYIDAPTIFEKLSDITSYYDKSLAIEYAEKAVRSAERNDWDVEYYKNRLNQRLKE